MNNAPAFRDALQSAASSRKPAALAGAIDITAPVQNGADGYRLDAGQALSMQARQAGHLRVAQGRVWVTFRNASQDCRVRAGDYFLECGDRLALAAGDAVVMEPLAVGGAAAPAWVCWDAAPVASALPRVRSASAPANPLASARRALGDLAGALAQRVRSAASPWADCR